MLLIVEIEYYQRSIIFRRLLFRNEKLFTISVPDFNFIVCLVIEGTRPEGIIIVSLMLQPSNFLRLPTTQPLPPRATFSSFPSLPRLFISSLPFLFFSSPFFFFLFFLFSLLPLFHLFPRAIGAFTLIKRPARDVYPGGVSVTSWARRVR